MTRRPHRTVVAAPQNGGKVRIIGGRWRGSRLDVPAIEGLRPSSDRVRETLFNWLQGRIAGARCLDLFAGSGALGFEAASRGAARVVLVERDPRVVQVLRDGAERLGAAQLSVQAADALSWLEQPPAMRFDLVFFDPPFAAGLLQPALDRLGPWLEPDAWVYIEHGMEATAPVLTGFEVWREGCTRDVRYCLLRHARGLSGSDAPVTLAPTPGA